MSYLVLTVLLCVSGCTTEVCYDCGEPFYSPKAVKAYSDEQGGVQIILVAYNEELNPNSDHVNDEYLILESDSTRSIRGWSLAGGEPRMDYSLPDSIDGVLRIFTHTALDSASRFQYGLHLPSDVWLWRNESPDTVRLYDAGHKLVDSLTY